MILVDTSVLINLLRGRENTKTGIFRKVIEKGIPFGISVLTYQEVLQGACDTKEWNLLQEYLNSQTIYYLPQNSEYYTKAAEIVFHLRRNGITPRSTIDILIATTAIENQLGLLHDDKDFDAMQKYVPELKIVSSDML